MKLEKLEIMIRLVSDRPRSSALGAQGGSQEVDVDFVRTAIKAVVGRGEARECAQRCVNVAGAD